MTRRVIPVLVALVITALSMSAPLVDAGRIRVVTSLNVLADFVQEVGGEQVEVTSLITGFETPHTYNPMPSDVRGLAGADLFVRIGVGLETWADKLVESAGNGLVILEVGSDLSLIEENGCEEGQDHGHGHGGANPHVWLSLDNAAKIVAAITEALTDIRPEQSGYFHSRADSYLQRLASLKRKLMADVSALKDKRLVSFPASYPYLFAEFGFQEVARGEEVHGQEPSALKMASIINIIRREKIKVIVAERHFSDRLARSLAGETKAKLVYLTPLLGGLPGTETYLEMMHYNVNQLVQALSS